jgi:ankyrin repeat-rich membrane spanning protein
MSTYDLTAQLMKNDYFLDVNPRNLRRLINIITLTGRLLRAYHIEFNWNVLASWIYLVEQWPYRCSWIVMSYEDNETEFSDETTLQEIYEGIRHKFQTLYPETLMSLDRNGRKFELLLENCQPPLNVLTLRKFLPCTCNLDPYLIKLIKGMSA